MAPSSSSATLNEGEAAAPTIDNIIVFSPNVSVHRRKLIHIEASRLKLCHFSTGEGKARYVSISNQSHKPKKTVTNIQIFYYIYISLHIHLFIMMYMVLQIMVPKMDMDIIELNTRQQHPPYYLQHFLYKHSGEFRAARMHAGNDVTNDKFLHYKFFHHPSSSSLFTIS